MSDGDRRVVTIADLSAAPVWPPERVDALMARVRGSMLRDWAAHVARRWGPEAVDRVRAAAAVPVERLPDDPPRAAWYPIGVQLRITRAVADVFTDGDLEALEPLLLEDGQRVRDRVARWAMRRLGPRRAIAGAPKLHPHLYDEGALEVRVERASAHLRWTGSASFAHPVWRALQMFAARSMIRVLARAEPTELVGLDAGPASFELTVGWPR